MNPIVRHIAIYATGLLSGVIITLAIVHFLNNSTKETVQQVTESAPREIVKTDTVKTVVYKSKKQAKANTVKELDSVANSLISDTLIYFEATEDSIQELKINKEVLIATKTFRIHVISNDTLSKNSLRDSLEHSMGIKKNNIARTIKVEFWKSPLNFEWYIKTSFNTY